MIREKHIIGAFGCGRRGLIQGPMKPASLASVVSSADWYRGNISPEPTSGDTALSTHGEGHTGYYIVLTSLQHDHCANSLS